MQNYYNKPFIFSFFAVLMFDFLPTKIDSKNINFLVMFQRIKRFGGVQMITILDEYKEYFRLPRIILSFFLRLENGIYKGFD